MNWKKIQLLVILVLSIFLVISCSHNDEEEELDNSGDNTSQDGENSGDTLPETIGNDEDKTDTASESGDSDALDDTDMPDNDNDPTDDSNDSDDTDISDTGMSDNDNDPADDPDDSDDIDTTDIDTSDNGDDTDTYPDTDSGDSQPDDDADADTSEPAFPECSPSGTKPCISGNLIWSETKKTKRTQGGCNTDCNNLNEAGYSSGWRLPTINELRTLVQNCSKTVSLPDGVCQVSDTCIKTLCKDEDNCKCSSGNDYSKLGDTDSLWSGTKVDSNMSAAWYINFSSAYIDSTNTSEKKSARCVHEIK